MKLGMAVPATPESGHIAEVARRLEDRGFESLWVGEHQIVPVEYRSAYPGNKQGRLPENYNRWCDPWVALSIAAAVTSQLHLGTSVCLPAEHNPLTFAKRVASLDHQSGGRLTVGIGAGWLREATEAMGQDFDTRFRRLRECLEAIRLLWTQPTASFYGEFVRFPAMRCEPKPAQRSGPPILIGALGPRYAERVVRDGDGWLPPMPASYDSVEQFERDMRRLHQVAEAAGRDPASLQVTIMVDPQEGNLPLDLMKRYRDAGVSRFIAWHEPHFTEMADHGTTLAWIDRYAPLVERAADV